MTKFHSKTAKYKCRDCNLEYEDSPGPTFCPSCGCLYITWLNYEAFRIDKKK